MAPIYLDYDSSKNPISTIKALILYYFYLGALAGVPKPRRGSVAMGRAAGFPLPSLKVHGHYPNGFGPKGEVGLAQVSLPPYSQPWPACEFGRPHLWGDVFGAL